jgi:hypothetical protein
MLNNILKNFNFFYSQMLLVSLPLVHANMVIMFLRFSYSYGHTLCSHVCFVNADYTRNRMRRTSLCTENKHDYTQKPICTVKLREGVRYENLSNFT